MPRSLRVRIGSADLGARRVDLGVCFAFEGDRAPRGIGDARLRSELAAQMRADGFRGGASERLLWNADARHRPRRFLVLGLGAERDTPAESIRIGAARAAQAAAGLGATSVALALPDGRGASAGGEEVRAAVEGAWLGAYQYERYLTDPARRRPGLVRLEIVAAGRTAAAAVRRAAIGARAVCLARDLVNEAPSRLTPTAFARQAASEARRRGLRCTVLREREIARLGMRTLLAVARGSSEPPRVVHLVYRPARRSRSRERVVLVGKGVTFDSGGLNLKPGDSMFGMKADMAGAAAVLAAMSTLREVGCGVEVHGLLGLTENMTGGAAYKPGDIVETYSGKTVEVGNTDAEGRLVLCDLLAYAAERLAPSRMVDLATLTGACVVALGTLATGAFSRHPEFRDALIAAGTRGGEKLWPMPMYDEYLPLLQKGPADLRNVAGRWGGAITAALFLGEFVPRDLPWVHLDIAGPSFAEAEQAEAPAGATGAGVLTLVRWLEGA